MDPKGLLMPRKPSAGPCSSHSALVLSPPVRTALIAIIGFMPTKGEGAIGSLDYTPEERRALAKKYGVVEYSFLTLS